MHRASWVVERMLICMNCGVPVQIMGGGVHLWIHEGGYRECAWLRLSVTGARDGTETYAAPTDWFEADVEWERVGFMSAEEARVLGGW